LDGHVGFEPTTAGSPALQDLCYLVRWEYFIRLKASVIGGEDEGRDPAFIYTLAFAMQLKKLMGNSVSVIEW
jgi:hypothetical protein